MGNIDSSIPYYEDQTVNRLERAASWGYGITDLFACLGFGFLAIAMTFNLCKMKRNNLFLGATVLCSLNYGVKFVILDWQLFRENQWAVDATQT